MAEQALVDAHAQRRRERDELIQRLLEERRLERERAAPVAQSSGAAVTMRGGDHCPQVAWGESASVAKAGPAANGFAPVPGLASEQKGGDRPPSAEPARAGLPVRPGARSAPYLAGRGEGAPRSRHGEPVGSLPSAQQPALRPSAQIRRSWAAAGVDGDGASAGCAGSVGKEGASHSSGDGGRAASRCGGGCGGIGGTASSDSGRSGRDSGGSGSGGSGNLSAGAGAESATFAPRINARSRALASARVGSGANATDRLFLAQRETEARRAAARMESARAEMAECTFAPQVRRRAPGDTARASGGAAGAREAAAGWGGEAGGVGGGREGDAAGAAGTGAAERTRHGAVRHGGGARDGGVRGGGGMGAGACGSGDAACGRGEGAGGNKGVGRIRGAGAAFAPPACERLHREASSRAASRERWAAEAARAEIESFP